MPLCEPFPHREWADVACVGLCQHVSQDNKQLPDEQERESKVRARSGHAGVRRLALWEMGARLWSGRGGLCVWTGRGPRPARLQ